jgi:hypothetical protein
MNSKPPLINTNKEDMVRDIDSFLGTSQNDYKYPFRIKKVATRVFDDVYLYPTEPDYAELSFLDSQQGENHKPLQFVFNSYRMFLQDFGYENRWAEIWENGSIFSGIKYKSGRPDATILLDGAESADNYTGSQDAGTPVTDNVFFSQGTASVRVPVILNTGNATVSWTLPVASALTNYRRKYFFIDVFLPSIPDDITLTINISPTDFLSQTVTTQFSGKGFEAGTWNTLAIDLNTANQTGVLGSSFVSASISINGVITGDYYIDASWLRAWELLDKWYYSNNACLRNDGVYQQGFYDLVTDTYEEDTSLIGPNEWSYVVMYGAMMISYVNKGEYEALAEIKRLFAGAEESLKNRYPSNQTVVTDRMWDFHNPATPPLTGYEPTGYVLR